MATEPDLDDPFPPLPCDSSESFIFQNKKPKQNFPSLKSPAPESLSPSSSFSFSHKSPENSSHHSPSSSSSTCLILRDDHKALPFNFFNSALPNWTALACLVPSSLERNQKGTVIVGQINKDKKIAFHSAPHSFLQKEIKYSIRVLQTHTP
jgi:hypothetical protein